MCVWCSMCVSIQSVITIYLHFKFSYFSQGQIYEYLPYTDNKNWLIENNNSVKKCKAFNYDYISKNPVRTQNYGTFNDKRKLKMSVPENLNKCKKNGCLFTGSLEQSIH